MNTDEKVNLVAFENYQHILEEALDGRARTITPPDDGPGVDECFDLRVGDNVWRLAVEKKSSPGRAIKRLCAHQDALRARWPEIVPILAVPRLSKREREALRANRINHMDLAGNVWIRSPSLLVTTEGARPPTARRPGPGRNPFSKKASLVSRVLLAHPSTHWRVREMAEQASLSVGYSSEVLQSLVDRGYAADTPDGFRLEDPVGLLAAWAGAYRWEDNEIHSFVAPYGKAELVRKACAMLRAEGVECLLTLLSAADRIVKLVEHNQVHMYVTELSHRTLIELRGALHAEPVQGGGNLHLMEPYYGVAASYGAHESNGVRAVSDVQLFLDLVHYPMRGPEASEAILKMRLGPRLGLSASQIRTLGHEVGL